MGEIELLNKIKKARKEQYCFYCETSLTSKKMYFDDYLLRFGVIDGRHPFPVVIQIPCCAPCLVKHKHPTILFGENIITRLGSGALFVI
jgi:hypothetical protein